MSMMVTFFSEYLPVLGSLAWLREMPSSEVDLGGWFFKVNGSREEALDPRYAAMEKVLSGSSRDGTVSKHI